MAPVTALVRVALVLLVLGAVYATVLLLGIRRFGENRSWVIWALALGLLMAWGLWQTAEFPGGPILSRVYFLGTFLGIPLAGATWGVRRARSRIPESSVLSQAAKGLIVYVVALPLGLVIAVIPDAVRLFR